MANVTIQIKSDTVDLGKENLNNFIVEISRKDNKNIKGDITLIIIKKDTSTKTNIDTQLIKFNRLVNRTISSQINIDPAEYLFKLITSNIDGINKEQVITKTISGNDTITFHLELLQTAFTISDFDKTDPAKIIQNRPFDVKLKPSTGDQTDDQSFWDLILKKNAAQNEFKEYQTFIDAILNCEPGVGNIQPKYTDEKKNVDIKRLPFNRTEGYSLLKFATEMYVKYKYSYSNSSENTFVSNNAILPYYELIKSKIDEFFSDDKVCFLKPNDDAILLELIWNYWYEEGKVNQTMHALTRRFQNIKNGYSDPLANFELDPLRPLNNILWGYIQDTQHRLSITRMNYEFEHLYGMRLAGINIPGFNPADRRSDFLQSFHRLIYESTEYFIQADNTIIRPDGFKMLNALRDTHRILAQGAHNQFGDLPMVARIEMLIGQWILARPEVREFLGGRIMVPYAEAWMDRVDSMKTLQGWDNTSISFYRDLAVYGEKIILGIRYGNWTEIENRDNATNWADAFRDAIQRYIHSYFTITGIDLSAQNVNVNSKDKFLSPGMLIQQKLIREKIAMRR